MMMTSTHDGTVYTCTIQHILCTAVGTTRQYHIHKRTAAYKHTNIKGVRQPAYWVDVQDNQPIRSTATTTHHTHRVAAAATAAPLHAALNFYQSRHGSNSRRFACSLASMQGQSVAGAHQLPTGVVALRLFKVRHSSQHAKPTPRRCDTAITNRVPPWQHQPLHQPSSDSLTRSATSPTTVCCRLSPCAPRGGTLPSYARPRSCQARPAHKTSTSCGRPPPCNARPSTHQHTATLEQLAIRMYVAAGLRSWRMTKAFTVTHNKLDAQYTMVVGTMVPKTIRLHKPPTSGLEAGPTTIALHPCHNIISRAIPRLL